MSICGLPHFGCYGDWVNERYGIHTLYFTFGPIRIYFSHSVPVAFRRCGKSLVVKNNDGTLNDKHLDWIDSGHKADRISAIEFERQLAKLVNEVMGG